MALAVKPLQQFFQVSRGRNSQAKQQVLECLEEAVVQLCQEKIVQEVFIKVVLMLGRVDCCKFFLHEVFQSLFANHQILL